jgi:(R,R)-butanediol dehydrogenase/meso-butanediol dehydrogenase/diacetyl reductase
MKAAVLAGKQTIRIEDHPVPEIRTEEVLVEVKACGICGTDIHALLSGDFYPVGTVFGHECAGIVANVGSAVSGVDVGDRVVISPSPPCGVCIHCRNGRDNLCANHLTADIGSTTDRPGACAEFVRIPKPDRMIHPLADSITFEQAALVEPLAVAFHGVRQSRLQPGDPAVVLGAGPIGLGVIQFLRISGASRIIVVEISEKRAEMARRFGADVTVNPMEIGSGMAEKILSLTQDRGAEVVYECTGVHQVFKEAVQYPRSGGQVVAIGVIEKEAPVDAFTLLTREIEIKGSMCYTAAEFQMVIDFIERGRIETDAMISDVIALKDLADKGFSERVRSTDVVKIIVKP